MSGTSDSASGTNFEATKEPGEPDHACDPRGASVWYVWTAPASGRFSANVCDGQADAE